MKTTRLTAAFVLMALSVMVSAARAAGTAEYNVDGNKLALAGYDPVSYFQGGPVEGKKEITTVLDGITYRFATEEHKKLFVAEPKKYKPTYGGWCATAMADGKKVEIDPKNYKITNGRLFLFYNGFWGNAIKDWNKDEANMTAKADAAWKKTSGE